jgi:hypothetical protein
VYKVSVSDMQVVIRSLLTIGEVFAGVELLPVETHVEGILYSFRDLYNACQGVLLTILEHKVVRVLLW